VKKASKNECQRIVLVGHPFAPIGRGEDIRCAFRAFREVGMSPLIRDIYALEPPSDPEILDYLVDDLSHNVNIFFINGDEVPQVLKHLGDKLPDSAYNIIYPQWELSLYPSEWAKNLDLFDEVWAPSQFVFESLRQAVSKPVYYMPLPVEIRLTSFLGRRYFGLPESSYLYLFFFDLRSYIERKNPFAVIKAFEEVCALRPREDIRLVIKLNRPTRLRELVKDFRYFVKFVNNSTAKNKIIVIDQLLTNNEIKNLIRCCDCFVSLHRSEGFGRGMAEAMFLGKPVIATGYSGNLDFMNENNALLVKYKLINVKQGHYPYAENQVWAEPDISDAVNHMVKLLDNKAWGRQLGQIASRHIRIYFSFRAIGLHYKRRLNSILRTQKITEVEESCL